MTTDAEFLSGMMYGNDANGKDTAKTFRNTTDLGNAERLIDRHGEDLKYVHAWGRYLVFDGQRYEPDQCDAVKARATETVRSIYHEAGDALDEGERKALGSHAKKSESQRGIEAMLSLAQHMVAVKPKDLDADPWKLNVLNGTVDLKTGELLLHSRADLITKLAEVEYDPNAEAPVFQAFLEKVLPSEALRKFVQKAVGYSLTGDISEQSLFFLHGSGANGKTTLMNVVLGLTGEYGKQAAPDLLVAKRGAHPAELADLFGARLVYSTEVEDGARFAESLMKQLTGSERINARRMRENFWEFDPTHKIWLAANHKPTVKGTDHAIWRRIKLVPFTVTIPKAEQDPGLPEKLEAEMPGILAWAVRGCLGWKAEGLGEPKEVTRATDAYRAEQDVLAAFIEECCWVDRNAQVKFRDLYEAYQAWGAASGERPETKMKFGKRLDERGYENRRGGKNVAMRSGLGLLREEEQG